MVSCYVISLLETRLTRITGVRNPTACKNMCAMKVGDLAFFYASGGKGKLQPGITGIMEIVKTAEPDM